ncbi:MULTISPECIES: hypothetical protein [unclassified Mesorhizobium]|uniref:hypothetical protein n=1 Tax=unclassified Mesorhizobium TaxID=325217 RepID=UPI000F75763A|nr:MULTISPECIES: hypothetical protein [unclassified Mesorhizobium]AZO54849.1 hypothetical protein EJ077_16385 [Mesorhizobium sp. M8A.F.Ca.ET.057.01.1.1]RWE44168.1 MAG: hypothetical protein EOS80_19675 [Mesorhizobium sp.]
MARPRTPRAKAAVEASDKKNPQRFAARKEPKTNGPLGVPPKWIADTDTSKAKSAWQLFAKELPWLNESHRTLIGMAANIQGRIMAGQEVGVQAMNLLRQMLGQMGATPADATKISVADDEEDADDLLD